MTTTASHPTTTSPRTATRPTPAHRAEAPPSSPPPTPSRPSLLRDGIPRAIVLALACTCAFMVVMDTSIVNVALPSMRSALHLSSAGQQWVVDGYLLTLGGFLLLGARASDLFGRRRTLTIGIVVFVAGSLAGGLAATGPMLLVARAVQGVGASVLAPSGLTLVLAGYPDAEARAKAMALYGASGAVAASAGVLIGGVLTQAVSWRWVMFINVPVGIALLIGVRRALAPAAGDTRRGQLDVAGAATVTVGMGLLIEGLSRAQQHGWTAGLTLGALGLAVALLAAFVAIESRVREPLVRLGVFRVSGVAAGNVVVALNGTVLTASTFLVSQVLQNGLGDDALGAGLRLAPTAVLAGLAGMLSTRIVRRFGSRSVVFGGMLVTAAGFGWLGLMGDHPQYASNLLGPLIVIGAGLGLGVMPSMRAASAGVPAEEAGLAAGLFNVSRQVGAAVGIAALVTLAVSRTRHALAAGSSVATAGLHGNEIALLACGAICLVAALVSLLLPSAARRP